MNVKRLGYDQSMTRTPRDIVDGIVEQWSDVRPDVDVAPIHVIGRVSRLARLVERHLSDNFAAHGLEQWMYDVLATLRRTGSPYELTAGELVRQSMVTTGAITNRVDRLAERGFVERRPGVDRRTVIVRLTPAGLRLVDEVVLTHMRTEREVLESLSATQQDQLAALLRRTLVALGDVPAEQPEI
jgi:DNA-binding MarR family transcriptional regulator